MRPPPGWHGPWMETDCGGAAELQTDVMRFMAILALCLVAIFALVQAIPQTVPQTITLETPAEPEAPAVAMSEPTNISGPENSPANIRATTRATPPAAPAEVRTPVPSPPPVALAAGEPLPAADAGFVLRFESDNALKALVARSDVGLYAMHGERAKRLHVVRGRLEFWQASMPSAFHEMDASTVPGDVATALSRIDDGHTDVRWGVTLPLRLSQEIDGHLATGGDGELVISATGTLRLE